MDRPARRQRLEEILDTEFRQRVAEVDNRYRNRAVHAHASRPLPTEETHCDQLEIEDTFRRLDRELEVGYGCVLSAHLVAGELPGERNPRQERRAARVSHTSQLAAAAAGLEAATGCFVRVPNDQVGESHLRSEERR